MGKKNFFFFVRAWITIIQSSPTSINKPPPSVDTKTTPHNFGSDGLTFVSKLFWYKSGLHHCHNDHKFPQVLWLQNITTLPGWYEVLVEICCIWFSPNKLLSMMTKHLHLGLVSPKIVVPEFWSLFWCSFARLGCAAILFLERRDFSKPLFHAQSFSDCAWT